MVLDLDTRLELIKLFYKNNESPISTLRAYMRAHNMKKEPFSVQSISRLVAKFEESKSLHDLPKAGRPSKDNERLEVIENSLLSLQEANPHGHASSRSVAKQTGIPQSSVVRILAKMGYHPYKLRLHQELLPADLPQRINFANWILRNEESLKNIIWSDEAYFSLDGEVNRHNSVVWACENPNKIITKKLHSPKVCVWMGFSAKHKLQPFFFTENVNQDNYTDLLHSHVVPQLKQKRIFRSTIFQHDGAPPHFSLKCREFLEKNFGEDRVIGRGFGVSWPPRSPDLSPLDYYLWGAVKARVYHAFIPRDIPELKEKITDVINEINMEEINNSVMNIIERCQLVLHNNGSHF